MFSEADLRRLARGINEAAYDSNAWEPFFGDLRRVLNATTAGFICVSRDGRVGATSLFTGLEEQGITDYAEHFADKNVWVHRTRALTAGDVFTDVALCLKEDLRRTAFYNDYLRRYDVAAAIGACISMGETSSYITLMRPERRGDWPKWSERLLRELMGYLQRAVHVHRHLSLVEYRRATESQLLEALDAPVLIVNAEQKVVAANRAGQKILNARDGLVDRNGRLDAAHREDGARLSALLRSAVEKGHPAVDAPRWVQVRRANMRRPLSVFAAPPPFAGDPNRPDAALAVVFIVDPDRAFHPSTELLKTLYDLTPAEARVATLTATALSTRNIAGRTRTSQETVRTHLKRVFRKTRTGSQQELVCLIGTLPRAGPDWNVNGDRS